MGEGPKLPEWNTGIETDLLLIILALVAVLMLGLFILFIRKLVLAGNIEWKLSRQLKNKEYKELIQTAREYLEKKPSRFLVLYYLAQAYEGLENWVSAIKFYNDASGLIPQTHKLYTGILLRIAKIYTRLGKAKEALGYYLMVMEHDDSAAEAAYEIARYHYENRNIKKAREYLETLLKKRPGLLDARFLYGKILLESGNYAPALRQFELLEQYEPENHEIYYYKGKVLEASRQYTNSIAAFRKCLEFAQAPQEIREQCMIAIIQLFIRLKEFYNGIEDISRFLAEVKNEQAQMELIYLYAHLLWNTGEEYQSLKNYERVYRMNFQFKDVQVIYEKYKNILPHVFLSHYFSSNEEKFLFLCQKMLGRGNFQLQYRSLDFYIFSKGVFFIVFYRHIEALTFSRLTDIEVLLNSFSVNPQGLELYSLGGVTDDALTHALLKKSHIISGEEFLGLVKKAGQSL